MRSLQCRDWRNLTLYSANLDFSAFEQTINDKGDKAGHFVWYL
jgi:hypothetical protein